MKKISFDFDSTLDNQHIQEYASHLMSLGYEIHIVTSRPSRWGQQWKVNGKAYTIWDNDDLYHIAEILNINRENIHFMGYDNKYKFFENEDFIFHLDDDYTEVDEINEHTKTKGIVFDDSDWKEKCNELLKS